MRSLAGKSGRGGDPPAQAWEPPCRGAAAQLAALHDTLRHGPLQLQAAGAAPANRTGLPGRLKDSVEALSGMSLDGVKVHYNSSKPAQLNALAYAQGSEIHLAPGQERHLPHETWHLVQQAQGRVKPTLQMKTGILVNDDPSLEHEAELMGEKAIAHGPPLQRRTAFPIQFGKKARKEAKAKAKAAASASKAEKRRQDDKEFKLARASTKKAKNIHKKIDEEQAEKDLLEAQEKKAKQHEEELPDEPQAEEEIQPVKPARLDDEWMRSVDREIRELLGRKLQDYPSSSQSKFGIWQKQLGNFHSKWKSSVYQSDYTETQIKTLMDLIKNLNGYSAKAEKKYDERWKTEAMASDIVVSSSGFVVGATISLPDDSLLERKTLRRRLTVSKARHMWDFLDAETKEASNSLISAKADLASVEADILELGRDYKIRYLANNIASAYEYTTKNQRIFKVNKTQNEYPHCFPIGGPDVVSMGREIFNFHYGVKQSLATLAKGGFAGLARARELIEEHGVGDKAVAVMQAMTRLKLTASVCKTVSEGFQEAPEPEKDPQARLRAKDKKSMPRKQGQTVRKDWSGKPIK